jgi:hypothetical protein
MYKRARVVGSDIGIQQTATPFLQIWKTGGAIRKDCHHFSYVRVTLFPSNAIEDCSHGRLQQEDLVCLVWVSCFCFDFFPLLLICCFFVFTCLVCREEEEEGSGLATESVGASSHKAAKLVAEDGEEQELPRTREVVLRFSSTGQEVPGRVVSRESFGILVKVPRKFFLFCLRSV